MPNPFPYLCITVVLLTDGEKLSPHRDVQNHRVHQNATISFGDWEGGVLQVLEEDKWINQDSSDQWVFLNARDTYHRVTEVKGNRLSVIYHTPQHLHRLDKEDWESLRESGFPVDAVWELGLSPPEEDEPDEEVEEVFQTICESITMTPQVTPGLEDVKDQEISTSTFPDSAVMRPTLQASLWISEIIARSGNPKK